MDELQQMLTGKSGKQFRFFPRYHINGDAGSKGEGIYLFLDEKKAITDIQFLSVKEEITNTMQRMKDDGAVYFYFKYSANRLQSDSDIDDIKGSEDYRKKVD